MRIRFPAVLKMIGLIFALPGCGTGAGVPAETAQTGSPQAASLIPAVREPSDVATLARRPCELLTSQQAAGFELNLPPQQYDAALGDLGCKWTSITRDRRTLRAVRIDTFTDNPILEVAYGKRKDLPFFELTEIADYPALVSRTNTEIPICDIDVKSAERRSFSVTYESKEFNDNPQQSCEVGKQFAAAVLMNLPLRS
jgi:Protein of unknown function (DUF3558)